MEHRKQFKAEKLADIFPDMLNYYFEKIFSGIDSPKSGDGQWGKMHLDMVANTVQEFRAALNKRGLLNPAGNYEYSLAEVEYPVVELQNYYDGTSSLKDPRAANIFAYFIRDKIRKLEQRAAELDEEYQQEVAEEIDQST